jgi:hypothetical protein
MRTQVAKRTAMLLLALTVMLGLTTALMAESPASAATTTCTLDAFHNPYNYTLATARVDCVLTDPRWTFDGFTLYGSDPWFDDTVFRVYRSDPFLPPWRVELRNVNSFTFDEDWGEDELYAEAKIVTATGSFLVTTNTVVGEFSY